MRSRGRGEKSAPRGVDRDRVGDPARSRPPAPPSLALFDFKTLNPGTVGTLEPERRSYQISSSMWFAVVRNATCCVFGPSTVKAVGRSAAGGAPVRRREVAPRRRRPRHPPELVQSAIGRAVVDVLRVGPDAVVGGRIARGCRRTRLRGQVPAGDRCDAHPDRAPRDDRWRRDRRPGACRCAACSTPPDRPRPSVSARSLTDRRCPRRPSSSRGCGCFRPLLRKTTMFTPRAVSMYTQGSPAAGGAGVCTVRSPCPTGLGPVHHSSCR